MADADDGKTLTVRVSFTDDAGNEESLTSEATDAVTAPLTAILENMPNTHDGKILRDHAFTVFGGAVENAERIAQGSNLRWLITVSPDGDG